MFYKIIKKIKFPRILQKYIFRLNKFRMFLIILRLLDQNLSFINN